MILADDDRRLAADLGLYVRPFRADPPASEECWIVRSVVTWRQLGRIHVTSAACLYVTKFADDVSAIEETVAAALCWLADVDRHVRTGTYDGTETVVRRFASMTTRPRAVTLCGAHAAAADFTIDAATAALLNGEDTALCLTCRQHLEDRGIADARSSARETATRRQRAYVRHLLDEAALEGNPRVLGDLDLATLTRRDASAAINRLRALKARAWKGSL